MSQAFCLVREHTLEQGIHAVTLENDLMAMTLLPDKGADVYRLVYKPRSMDVLWKAPWGLRRPGTGVPTAGTSEEAWMEYYSGGWQEIFPNGGDACIYKNCHLNFHGEVSVLPWECTLEQTGEAASVEFRVATYRSPFLLRRKLTIEPGKAVVHIHEQMSNRAEEEMHFMWGHHPAYGAPFLDGDCFIQLPEATFQAHDVEISPSSQIVAGTVAEWPKVPGKSGLIDLSRVPPITERHCEFGYLRNLKAGWYAMTSRKYDFSVALVWPQKLFPYLWFWQELRGSFGYPWYGNSYVMAIEPFSSIPGNGLENAIAAGTALVIQAGGTIEAQLAVMFIPGQARIESLAL
jgi:galactose mutarotase-like enzyme